MHCWSVHGWSGASEDRHYRRMGRRQHRRRRRRGDSSALTTTATAMATATVEVRRTTRAAMAGTGGRIAGLRLRGTRNANDVIRAENTIQVRRAPLEFGAYMLIKKKSKLLYFFPVLQDWWKYWWHPSRMVPHALRIGAPPQRIFFPSPVSSLPRSRWPPSLPITLLRPLRALIMIAVVGSWPLRAQQAGVPPSFFFIFSCYSLQVKNLRCLGVQKHCNFSVYVAD